MERILYVGKTKVIYEGADDKTVTIGYKDTTTAFNGEKKQELIGKGKLNAAISNFIYKYLTENGIETHLIEEVDTSSITAKRAEIIQVEVIVRNVAAGCFSAKYGVPEGTELRNSTVEFCIKSDTLGDPMVNASQITAIGLATADELNEMSQMAVKINELLCELFTNVGIRLIDFKLEFGRYDGRIILCDEISPDSCRLWEIGTDRKLDKDRFRRDLGNVLGAYKEVLRRLENVK
ncbi:MAG: phosphoribosylaminoimidazolesuccinocarboxamide synthase [Oscillospiraceae bacterium]|nr:phosphoribosylaminoimidazolesuccinocarboxamide synthase [Oscillospiraceae bacterium]